MAEIIEIINSLKKINLMIITNFAFFCLGLFGWEPSFLGEKMQFIHCMRKSMLVQYHTGDFNVNFCPKIIFEKKSKVDPQKVHAIIDFTNFFHFFLLFSYIFPDFIFLDFFPVFFFFIFFFFLNVFSIFSWFFLEYFSRFFSWFFFSSFLLDFFCHSHKCWQKWMSFNISAKIQISLLTFFFIFYFGFFSRFFFSPIFYADFFPDFFPNYKSEKTKK